jgi:hypothetical protein
MSRGARLEMLKAGGCATLTSTSRLEISKITGCARTGAAIIATAITTAVFMIYESMIYVRSKSTRFVGDAQSVAVGKLDSLSGNSRKELEVKLGCEI